MITSYRTVGTAADAEIEVKRSRFLCHVERVESEEDARAVIGSERRQMRDARHHCSAFVVGPDGALRRSNDDGEPAGTAGTPMLEVLTGRELNDVVAVVTRYFGGVLLGSGGLARAYSDAVGAALDRAGAVRRELRQLVEVSVDHGDAGRLENDLRARGITVDGVDYGAEVTIHLAAPAEGVDDLVSQVAALSSGGAGVVIGGQRWADLE